MPWKVRIKLIWAILRGQARETGPWVSNSYPLWLRSLRMDYNFTIKPDWWYCAVCDTEGDENEAIAKARNYCTF